MATNTEFQAFKCLYGRGLVGFAEFLSCLSVFLLAGCGQPQPQPLQSQLQPEHTPQVSVEENAKARLVKVLDGMLLAGASEFEKGDQVAPAKMVLLEYDIGEPKPDPSDPNAFFFMVHLTLQDSTKQGLESNVKYHVSGTEVSTLWITTNKPKPKFRAEI